MKTLRKRLVPPADYRPSASDLTRHLTWPSLPVAWLVFSFLLVGGPLNLATESPRPNLIFIMADDLGYGDLGCYGQRQIRTPHLDRMAAEGIRFTQVYAGSPVCAPARSVLMTGQHTGHTRVRGNAGQAGAEHGAVLCTGRGHGWRVPLRPEDVTVAEVLQSAGYTTGITGKWGLGEPGTTGTPNRKGFHEWFGFLNQARAHEYYPDYLWRDETRFPLPGNLDGRQEQYAHDLFTEFSLDFVRRHARTGAPFFLYLAYTVPHDKFQIPELEPYAEAADWSRQERVYASMVTRLDRDIGRLLGLLDELGVDRQTAVFFCSDNGAANRYDGVFDSSGPLRGRKRDLYEGGLRVPMIVRWPGRIPAGLTSDAIWYFTDLLPTFAALAGTTPPAAIDGRDLGPTLLGQDQPDLRQRLLYWEFFERGFQQAARRGDWKVVRPGFDQPLQVFDLARDPGETQDLAGAHPDIVARFEADLKSVCVPFPDWPAPVDTR